MSTTLKTQLGLGDPKSPQTNQGSTEQADKFKAAFQAISAKINECLQYTAAYAEQTKHDPQAAKRDTTCQAYQVALQRIDPTNSAAAQGAIDQVLAGVETLQSAVTSLKTAVEKAYNDWMGSQGEFESASDKIREMVEWGHDKANALQEVITTIVEKANKRNFEGAFKGVGMLAPKLATIYAEFERQRQAQQEYEPALAALQSRLDAVKECSYKSLADTQQAISAATDQMQQAATAKNYVDALTQLRTLEGLVKEFEDRLAALEAKKQEYETARQALDTKLTEASQCQFKVLAELDQKIADLTTKTDTAATDEKYDEAVTLVGELSTAVEEKLQKTKELEEKKAEYDPLAGEITPRLPNQCEAEYPSLEPMQTELATLNDQMVKAAEAEDYETAVTCANDLKAKLDTYEKSREELVKKKEEYATARATLDPKLGQASTCKHESLAKLDEEIAKMAGELDKAAAAKDYGKALEIIGQLSTKCDTKLSEEARLDRKIIGDAQKERADKKYEALNDEGKKRFNKLVEGTKSSEERDYIMKSLAANYSMDDIEAFAKKINGKDKDWLQNNLKLTGNTDGKGVKQQWSHSCNATTTQALRGELDPIYALKLHEENKDITTADNSDGAKANPKLAKEQKKALESEYSGPASGKHKGKAVARDQLANGSGRWADDLMNDMSDVTGVEYANQKIGSSYKVDDAVKDIDSGLKKGHPVPIVIGNSSTAYTHYVLVTGRDPGPPETFTIHDPWDGVTVKRSVQDVKDGKINLAGSNQISALEKPSTKEDKKK
jgi:hypothetical protein